MHPLHDRRKHDTVLQTKEPTSGSHIALVRSCQHSGVVEQIIAGTDKLGQYRDGNLSYKSKSDH